MANVILKMSFDTYNGTGTGTGLQSEWTAQSGNGVSAMSLVTGLLGNGQALQINSAGAVSSQQCVITNASSSPIASGAIGVRMQINNFVGATNALMYLVSGTTSQFGLYVTSTGQIGLGRYASYSGSIGTSIATSASGVISSGAINWVEIEYTINNTTGAATVYVNDTAVLGPLTNINNRNGTTNDWDGIGLAAGFGSGQSVIYDDLYAVDAATRLGQRKIKTLYPSSDVLQGFSRSTGADNYSLVNEAHANGDTSYVQGGLSALDRYVFDALGLNPATIDALQLSAFVENTDAFARLLALQVKSGATISDGTNFGLSQGTYGRIKRILQTDPNTAAAWVAANVPPQAGPKVTQ